ncbi:helix-turn-helix transcriptional regulator [Paraburkholderia acidisoli]|uniref:Shikimate kinase n=1 Tax=Paraburkholderia acidisoli TaxID=2571748 RepID=A0A7Z2GKD9_9BURK|nr:helix-turn-helix transcriptional regulator [Paraburkholderia acidisoli]QGZ63343.1 helix-turn-helix domain-containing protein [Paraburkholderia acidisoli]
MPDRTPAPPRQSSAEDEALLLAALAKRIRTLRAQRGMTRKQLAEQSGVSIPYLARVEAGSGNVSLALLHKLARALNVPVEALLTSPAGENSDLLILIEYLKQQSPEVLSRLRRQVMMQPAAEPATRERIALLGLRGAGKSTVGPLLAERLGAPFVELDKEIEAVAGIAIGEVITVYGQAAMRRIERQCIERIVERHERVVLATGGGIVSESATYEVALRAFFTVWLKARPDVHFERVMKQNDARIATPPLRKEALEHIHKMLDARASLYQLADASIDTSDLTPGEVVARVAQLATQPVVS